MKKLTKIYKTFKHHYWQGHSVYSRLTCHEFTTVCSKNVNNCIPSMEGGPSWSNCVPKITNMLHIDLCSKELLKSPCVSNMLLFTSERRSYLMHAVPRAAPHTILRAALRGVHRIIKSSCMLTPRCKGQMSHSCGC